MSNIIRIKRGITGGVVPTGLTFGEIAVNITDKKLFVGGVTGNTIEILGGGGASAVAGVSSFNGITGAVGITVAGNLTLSLTGFTGADGKTFRIYSKPYATVKGTAGAIAWADTSAAFDGDGSDLGADNSLKFNYLTDLSLQTPGSFKLGTLYSDSVIQFGDGTTQGTAFRSTDIPTIRLATTSLTGVASFNANDFGVSATGHVSLTGNVARTNATNNFTAVQSFPNGISGQSIRIGSGATFGSSYIDFTAVSPTLYGYNTGGYLRLQSFGTLFSAQSLPSITLQDADYDLGGIPSITVNPSTGSGGGTVNIGNSSLADINLQGNTVNSGKLSVVRGLSAQSLLVAAGSTFSGRASFTAGLTTQSLSVSQGATFGSTVSINNYLQIAGATAWHAGNDGKDSGLDAGLLYGIDGRIFSSNLATGLLYGGILSINADPTKFNITAGRGQIHFAGATHGLMPDPGLTQVGWTAGTGLSVSGLTSHDTTWILIDASGNLIQQPNYYTDDQIENTILIGALVHPSRTSISLAKTIPNVAYATDKQYEQFIRSFGPVKISGHTIQPNGANMKLNRTSGSAFILGRNYINDANNPSVISDIAKSDAEFWRYYRGATAGSFVTQTGQTVIDPANYDDGSGTLAGVSPSSPFTIQRIFFFPGTPNVLGVYYGRAQYASLADAANNIHLEDFTEVFNTATNAVFVASLIVKYNVTDLTTAIAGSDARIIQAGAYRSTTSGGGTVATKLDDLTDITIANVVNHDVLIFDGPNNLWFNQPIDHIAVRTVNGMTGNISLPLATTGSTGVASFDDTYFQLGSTGHVSIKTGIKAGNLIVLGTSAIFGAGATGALPALDGSALTGVNAYLLQGKTPRQITDGGTF